MNNEQIKASLEMGQQAAYIYNGALTALKNGKQAERITFLFFSAVIFGKDETVSLLLNMFNDKNK